MSLHDIKFVASGRGKAQCAPNPAYPTGIAVDAMPGFAGETCTVELPYPAPECGIFEVRCNACGISIALTAAGRIDDPISVRIPCALDPAAHPMGRTQ